MGSENPGNGRLEVTDSGGEQSPRGPASGGGDGASNAGAGSENARTVRQRRSPVVVQRGHSPKPDAPSVIEQLFKAASQKTISPPDDDEIKVTCPNLWELLTTDRYPDGRDRFLAEIVIKRIDGAYLAELRDHETLRAKHGMALKLLDVPQALEEAICDHSKPWRAFKSFVNPKGLDRHKEKKA